MCVVAYFGFQPPGPDKGRGRAVRDSTEGCSGVGVVRRQPPLRALPSSSCPPYPRPCVPAEDFSDAPGAAVRCRLPIASLTYKPAGPPASGVIDCGPYSNPDYGCSAEDFDGAAAFLQAVLFVLTDNPTYATNAMQVGWCIRAFRCTLTVPTHGSYSFPCPVDHGHIRHQPQGLQQQ
jgi:hypothetical protein